MNAKAKEDAGLLALILFLLAIYLLVVVIGGYKGDSAWLFYE